MRLQAAITDSGKIIEGYKSVSHLQSLNDLFSRETEKWIKHGTLAQESRYILLQNQND